MHSFGIWIAPIFAAEQKSARSRIFYRRDRIFFWGNNVKRIFRGCRVGVSKSVPDAFGDLLISGHNIAHFVRAQGNQARKVMTMWGKRNVFVNLGHGIRRCEICEKDRSFSLVLSYQLLHFYYIFCAVFRKHYLYLCDICQRGWEVDAQKIESSFRKLPIPLMHRYGGIIFVIGIFWAIFLGILTSR